MASAAADNAYGITVVFGTTTALNALQVTDVTPPPLTRDAIEVVHLASTTSTWIEGGVVHVGEMSMEVHFNPDIDPEAAVGAAIEEITINWLGPDDANGAKLVFQGFVTRYEPGQMTTDQLMTGTIGVQFASSHVQTADGA